MTCQNERKNRNFADTESRRIDAKKTSPLKEKTDSSACLEEDPQARLTTYRMVIAYEGTDFSGWQVQPNDISIQGLIEEALTTITHEKVRVIGAGRTDAGVHAMGQEAHFRLERPVGTLKKSLNGLLPPAIRIIDLQEAPDTFHAQRSATGKIYHYHICLREVVLPFERLFVWHCRRPVNISLLEEAAQHFIGERDFLGFANAPGHGCHKKTSVRIIRRLDVIQTESGVRLEFEGNGFLYKMVRNITGMMVGVASGKRPLEEIEAVFTSKDRTRAEPAAPPQGLFLMHVYYPDDIDTSSS